jgi:uncharacterized membrane protein YqaE (UPF0057 family)
MIYALAILCPPLALLLMGRGLHALVNLPLTLLFWLPGVVHACVVISRMERDWRDERLACMLKGVPPPARPGTVPGWVSTGAIVVSAVFFFGVAWMTAVAPRFAPQPTAPVAASEPIEPATPATPEASATPAAGALFAEVVAAFGEPNLARKETGWAHWNGFKARFQDGRVVEVTTPE